MASALYKGVIKSVDKLVPGKLRGLWEHPAGPKTVFFWAPTMKWCLVGAGIADIARPAEKLSVTQRYVEGIVGLLICLSLFPIFNPQNIYISHTVAPWLQQELSGQDTPWSSYQKTGTCSA